MMKYIPQSDGDRRNLLQTLGVENVDELFQKIPSEIRYPNLDGYPLARSEMEIRESFDAIERLQTPPRVSFAGGGVYAHMIPSIVPFLLSRSEFATAYTPYQPEVSQGLLQSIYEYQSLMCQLTECELSNASLYDGATALAEGILMGLRIQKKSDGKILIGEGLHPFYEEVLQTYLSEFQERIERMPLAGDVLDRAYLEDKLQNDTVDLVVTASPNLFGVVENYAEIAKLLKASKALWVTTTMEPLVWGLIRGPGAFGAHIVTAEGQSFGNAAGFGGSSFGIFCTKQDYIRNLPGRLVGETLDEKNRRSYTLTFATREQHIRRHKATSNICTNHNLNMLGGLIYLSTLGKQGLRELAQRNLDLSEYAKAEIKKQGLGSISNSPTFNEFVLETTQPAARVIESAAQEGWVAGIDLGRFREDWKTKLLVHFNERHKKEDIDHFIHFLRKAL